MENPFFKEGDTLVYVVWYDDNEPYEDNYQCIDAIFSSWDEAENYLNNKQLIKKESDWNWVYSAGISGKVKKSPIGNMTNMRAIIILHTLLKFGMQLRANEYYTITNTFS